MNPQGGAGHASSDASAPKACPSCGARYAADALFCSLDGSPLTTSPGAIAAAAANDYYVGREILGHIEIRQLVGLGAMGRVYRAFQRGIDRDVAVKILHRELSANPAVVTRFNREAKVASRLAHPNVVHVLLVGQLPDGAMYIVMEYLDGMSLQSALAAAGGALPLPRALHIAVQLSDAAGEAHAQGIVHRDLKPENVMLIERADDPDYVKVLDFGIARLSWGDQSMATAAGLIFGTARYISPEGARGEKVGPQGDVYSIATMVYQMLAGRTPFDADQAVALLVQQIHDAPPPLKGIPRAGYVPDSIAATVMRNLSKRPEERAENARAFGRALLEAAMTSGLSAQDILARPSLLPGGRGGAQTSIQMPSMQRTRQLALEPGVAERMGPGPGKTAYETPSPAGVDAATAAPPTGGRTIVRTEISDPSGAPPGMSTVKWGPPGGLPAAVTGRAGAPPSRPPSSVDATLADEQAPAAPAKGRTRSTRTLALGVALMVLGVLGVAALRSRGGQGAEAARRSGSPGPLDPRAEESQRGGPESSPTAGSPSSSAVAQAESVPPLLNAKPPLVASTPLGSLRAVIETSSAKPGIGQPVDLSARVLGGANAHPRVESPRFRIAGPGLAAGTELAAVDDGTGVFRTTFTFLQGGRFEVTFLAHADGVPVRSARTLAVDEPSAPAPVPPSNATAAPGPAASSAPGKWL